MGLRKMRSISLAMCITALIGGCAPNGPVGPEYKIATAPEPSGLMLFAQAVGVLGGQTNTDGTACFWLGDAGSGTALFWPYGYSARTNPLAVYDASGNRVAAVGQTVTMGGGLMGDDVHSITGCSGYTSYWGVGQVQSAH
jgi:hypothetical protein